MVNAEAVQPSSYGCTWEVAKHERSVRVSPRVTLVDVRKNVSTSQKAMFFVAGLATNFRSF